MDIDLGTELAVTTIISERSAGTAAGGQPLAPTPNWQQILGAVALRVHRNGSYFLSSAVMISPTMGLTAAHSLENVSPAQAAVIQDVVVQSRSSQFKIHSIRIHPHYKGNRFDGVDLAVFELETPMRLPHYFMPVMMRADQLHHAVLQRVGFGERDQENRRTWVLEQFDRRTTGEHYLTSTDQFGFPGDSGGPVYTTHTTIENPRLVGIHVGRMLDSSGALKDESNTLIFNDEILKWVNSLSQPATRLSPGVSN